MLICVPCVFVATTNLLFIKKQYASIRTHNGPVPLPRLYASRTPAAQRLCQHRARHDASAAPQTATRTPRSEPPSVVAPGTQRGHPRRGRLVGARDEGGDGGRGGGRAAVARAGVWVAVAAAGGVWCDADMCVGGNGTVLRHVPRQESTHKTISSACVRLNPYPVRCPQHPPPSSTSSNGPPTAAST